MSDAETPETDHLLQLQLRAGDAEGTGKRRNIFDLPESNAREVVRSLEDEFEALRLAGPKLGKSQAARMRHIEWHLDAGDVICCCGMERSQTRADSED